MQPVDENKIVQVILIDNLINKSSTGVNDVAKNLLQSYLAQRLQVVDFNGFISDTLKIKTGVSQGSVLGPFNFSVYSKDLPSWTDLFKNDYVR